MNKVFFDNVVMLGLRNFSVFFFTIDSVIDIQTSTVAKQIAFQKVKANMDILP